MRTVVVVVANKVGQEQPHVTVADRNQVIQALAAGGPHPALRDRVRFWRLARSTQAGDAESGAALAEVHSPDPVAIMDQVGRLAAPGCGLDHLTPDPGSGGMGGDLEVEELATAVADEEEDVEGLEGEGLNHKQIRRPDRSRMVGQEGAPALA